MVEIARTSKEYRKEKEEHERDKTIEDKLSTCPECGTQCMGIFARDTEVITDHDYFVSCLKCGCFWYFDIEDIKKGGITWKKK